MVKLAKALANFFLCKIFYRVKFINKENEESLDKCLICSNHSNTVEPAWIFSKTNNLAIMAKAELFESRFNRFFLTRLNVFPIKRGEHDARSLIHAIHLFKGVDKRKLLIFPEGQRIKKDRERGNAKVGPIYIAYKANVPIVPVYITKNAKIFSKVKIIYGTPIYITKEDMESKDKIQILADRLLDNCYELNK